MPNVMAIRELRDDNMSKQTTSLAGFDVALPIGVASRSRDLMFFIGKKILIFFVSNLTRRTDEQIEHFYKTVPTGGGLVVNCGNSHTSAPVKKHSDIKNA